MTASAWLVSHAHLLPTQGRALDVAAGRGRHALWLAARGLDVDALDRDREALEALVASARAQGLDVRVDATDLEAPGATIAPDRYDVVVVVHYLHRPLFPALLGSLRPGGLLVYETFTRAQAKRGKPTNPAFLLEPGELVRLVAPLQILDAREGVFDGRDVASVVARRPSVTTP